MGTGPFRLFYCRSDLFKSSPPASPASAGSTQPKPMLPSGRALAAADTAPNVRLFVEFFIDGADDDLEGDGGVDVVLDVLDAFGGDRKSVV